MHRFAMLLALGLGGLASATPPGKTAPPRADVAKDARKVFDSGLRAYKQGKFAEALTLFQRAYELKPHPSIRFNFAKCQEGLGQTAAALKSYRTYLFEVPDTADREVVNKAITSLEAKLQRVHLQQLMVVVEPHDAQVSVDGVSLGASPAFIELGVGDHRVVAELEGLETLSRSFVMSTSKSLELTFVMQPPPPPMPTITPPPVQVVEAPPAVVASSSQGTRVGPIVVTILGGAALIAGAVFTGVAAAQWNELNSPSWHSANTWATQQGVAQGYSRNVILGPSLLGAGVAAGVTGILWLVLGSSPQVAQYLGVSSSGFYVKSGVAP